MNKCFCHFNGYEVKDAKARENSENNRNKINKLENDLNDKITKEENSRITNDKNMESELNNVKSQITSLSSGSPLVASSIEEMTDTSKIYVNTSDGKWYYYNGSEWIAGGVYQATVDSETLSLLNEFVFNNKNIEKLEKNIRYSVNKFNKNSIHLVKDKLVGGGSNVGANYSDYPGYYTSHPIYVEGGKTYKSTKSGSIGNNNKLCYVDGNGEIIPTGFIERTYTDDNLYTIFTPPKSGFIRISIGNSEDINNFMLCEEIEFPSEYVPFIYEDNNILINENPLKDKKISFNGDSICYGEGFTGGYASIIGTENNMVVQNIGVSGATIVSGTTKSSGSNRHWICDTVVNMDEDSDFAILEGGVNDASLSLPLGTITEGYTDTLDTTTYYGAFEYMLKTLITRFKGKKYGYIAVHQMATNYRCTNDESTSYYWASKKCCEKWGVPFLDLNKEIPPFDFFPNAEGHPLTELKDTYTHNGDGWHPNEEGYRKFYCDKIEAWLESL
jgi:lysophospholipase L1-like esterase